MFTSVSGYLACGSHSIIFVKWLIEWKNKWDPVCLNDIYVKLKICVLFFTTLSVLLNNVNIGSIVRFGSMGQTNRYSHDDGTTNLLGLHKSGNMKDSWGPWGLNCSVN